MHHAGGVGGEPTVLQQEHHSGIEQNGGLVEYILQGHQAHTGAQRQAAVIEIVGLHGHSPGTQADHVAKGAHKGGIQAAPQGEARQAAADDEPADDSLKQGVCQADGQHQQHLPEGELGQRGRDLGPVAAEDENHYTGQRQQHQQRKDRLFAGGLLGGVGLFHGTRLLSRYCLQYNTEEPCFCELKQNFSRHFV